MGFSCLTIFNLLQFPLLLFPEMVNMLVRAGVSVKRIIAYLETDDVRGIPRIDNSSSSSGSGSYRMIEPFSSSSSSPLSRKSTVPSSFGSVSLSGLL